MQLQVCETRVERVDVGAEVPLQQQLLHAPRDAASGLQGGAVAGWGLCEQGGLQSSCVGRKDGTRLLCNWALEGECSRIVG